MRAKTPCCSIFLDKRLSISQCSTLRQQYHGFPSRPKRRNALHLPLPYSPTQALVESTLFTTTVLERQFYVDAINEHLRDHYGASITNIIHEEQGGHSNGNLVSTRRYHTRNRSQCRCNTPSEWVHIRVYSSTNSTSHQGFKTGKATDLKRPHKAVDVWMDAVLLTVLKTGPSKDRSCLEGWLHRSPVMNSFDS